MERRFTPAASERQITLTRADGQPATINGYAAVYYDGSPGTQYDLWAGAIERIMPGAFDRAVAEDDVRALFNHDPNLMLGRTTAGTLALTVDARGLGYRINPPDTQTGRDVTELVRRRDVTGSSFAFVVTEQGWRTESGIDIREIRGVRLFDVGPVTYPAYTATSSDVRAEARASHEQWRIGASDGQDDEAAAIPAGVVLAVARAVEIENQG